METIGRRLRAYVEAHTGWTYRQFCREVGVSAETGRKWVTGVTAPNRNRARLIAAKLGKSVEWVLVGAGPRPLGLSPALAARIAALDAGRLAGLERIIDAHLDALDRHAVGASPAPGANAATIAGGTTDPPNWTAPAERLRASTRMARAIARAAAWSPGQLGAAEAQAVSEGTGRPVGREA